MRKKDATATDTDRLSINVDQLFDKAEAAMIQYILDNQKEVLVPQATTPVAELAGLKEELRMRIIELEKRLQSMEEDNKNLGSEINKFKQRTDEKKIPLKEFEA